MRTTNLGLGRTPACLALILGLAGCATGGATVTRGPSTISVVTGDGAVWEVRRGPDVQANQQVGVTAQQAWARLPQVFAALGMTPDMRDPAALSLGVSRHRFVRKVLNRTASDFFDCGTDPGLDRPTADQVPIEAQVVTQVLPAATGTELRTTVTGTALRSGGNAGIATCRSTGLMEMLIGQMVQKTAAPGGMTHAAPGATRAPGTRRAGGWVDDRRSLR